MILSDTNWESAPATSPIVRAETGGAWDSFSKSIGNLLGGILDGSGLLGRQPPPTAVAQPQSAFMAWLPLIIGGVVIVGGIMLLRGKKRK